MLNKPWKLKQTALVDSSITANDKSRKSKPFDVGAVNDVKTQQIRLAVMQEITGAVLISMFAVIVSICVITTCGKKVDEEGPRIDDDIYYEEDYDEKKTDIVNSDTNNDYC